MDVLTDTVIMKRLLMALLLGGLIGLERQLQRREAGLRTHILVSLGSSLISLTSLYLFWVYQGITAIDPSRIASGIVTGIGFLGAGTIIRDRENIKGLTTAASLWVVAAIGMACGCGFLSAAMITTAFSLIVLLILRRWEKIIFGKNDS